MLHIPCAYNFECEEITKGENGKHFDKPTGQMISVCILKSFRIYSRMMLFAWNKQMLFFVLLHKQPYPSSSIFQFTNLMSTSGVFFFFFWLCCLIHMFNVYIFFFVSIEMHIEIFTWTDDPYFRWYNNINRI